MPELSLSGGRYGYDTKASLFDLTNAPIGYDMRDKARLEGGWLFVAEATGVGRELHWLRDPTGEYTNTSVRLLKDVRPGYEHGIGYNELIWPSPDGSKAVIRCQFGSTSADTSWCIFDNRNPDELRVLGDNDLGEGPYPDGVIRPNAG